MMNSQQYSGIGAPAPGGESFNAMSSLLGVYKSAKEKWDASGGNEALGRVTASIPDSTKSIISGLFKREHFRGITVYFGIGEERPFYIEKNASLLLDRLKHNFTFFYLNYFALTAILFCLTLLISPSAIIGIALLGAAWFWLIRSTQANGTLQIYSINIPQQTAVIGMGGISVLVLFYLLSGIFWWTLFSSGFLILLHAFFRDASMHKDMDDVVKMEGDLHFASSTEDSAFLNSRV